MATCRVLHLITRFVDGGAEKTTLQTIRALAEADADYDLRLGFGSEYDDEQVTGLPKYVTPVCFRTLRHYNPVTPPLAVIQIARYLRSERIDIIHTHSTEAGLVGRWAAALARTPVVIHEIHGDPVADDRHWLLNRTVEMLERASARLSDHLVIKSDILREEFIERDIGTPEQYEIIYHGVDIDAYAEAAQNPRDTDRLVLLYVGRVVEGKGLFDLLDVFERLSAAYDVELRIAGDGPLLDDIRDAVADRHLDNVTLCGYVDDVAAELAAADVFVLPSYREGTPRAITEALAAGVPVVATSIAGIPDQVTDGESGLLFEPGDHGALERSLTRLIESPDKRARMGRVARTSVSKFAIETAEKKYRALYERVSGSCRP